MKNACEKWKDPLREAALTGTTAKDLEEHLRNCAKCSAEMEKVRARAARLDALLPLVAQQAEPSADFRARVLGAAEAAREGKRARPWRLWTLAGAAAVVVVVLMAGMTLRQRTARMIPGDELAAAQKLAEWRAPSDGLLVTPGREILRKMPRLGESYLNVLVKKDEEEMK
jgi:predicted anti-sigma-YlaC factor YlaD